MLTFENNQEYPNSQNTIGTQDIFQNGTFTKTSLITIMPRHWAKDVTTNIYFILKPEDLEQAKENLPEFKFSESEDYGMFDAEFLFDDFDKLDSIDFDYIKSISIYKDQK